MNLRNTDRYPNLRRRIARALNTAADRLRTFSNTMIYVENAVNVVEEWLELRAQHLNARADAIDPFIKQLRNEQQYVQWQANRQRAERAERAEQARQQLMAKTYPHGFPRNPLHPFTIPNAHGDGDGINDDTAAIQAAIDDAFPRRLPPRVDPEGEPRPGSMD